MAPRSPNVTPRWLDLAPRWPNIANNILPDNDDNNTNRNDNNNNNDNDNDNDNDNNNSNNNNNTSNNNNNDNNDNNNNNHNHNHNQQQQQQQPQQPQQPRRQQRRQHSYPLRACWPAVGRQPLKSGQGPPGRGIAVRQFSPLRRREGPRPLPATSRSGQKVPRFTVFCALPIFSHFSDLVVSDGSTWANIGLKMGQYRPQDGPT